VRRPVFIDEITGFNQLNRDRWVASVAARLVTGAAVLDAGAGECRYRSLFSHCDYHAQDFCAYAGTAGGVMPERWDYGSIDYVSDITRIPAPDGRFDAVLCTELLEHVPEPIAALRELARILRLGGRLFLSAPLGSGLHQQPHHYYGGFTPHFYRRFLPALGFDVHRIEPNGGFFRHLLQELNRASHLIQSRRRYPKWHPLRWVLRYGMAYWLPIWLSRLDDEHFIEEFTVGYHVEAEKVRQPPEDRA
jgi:SAM-dependent methyltransferase